MSVPVAVVVVTHDTRDEVLGCLDSVRCADELVVVDTGSTDGTAAAVRAHTPGAMVLELANAGFGRGANAGVRACTAPVVIVANADVRFAADTVAGLADAVDADPSVGAAGPAVRDDLGELQPSARRVPDLTTALGHALLGRVASRNRWTARYHARDAEPGEARDVEWLSGCALAIRRRAFDEVDGFDPGYFLYVEDVDLGVRLREKGWRLRYVPAVEVVHRGGASTARRPVRALIAHARSIDRYYGRTRTTPLARVLRPVVRAGLATWVGLGIVLRRDRRRTP